MTQTPNSSIIGIDVGKDELHVCLAPRSPRMKPDKSSVHILDLTRPRWWEELIALIAPNAVIAAESTGYHLLAPVAAVVRQYRPDARIWQVEGKTTGRYRNLYVAAAKTDILDAIALCQIAAECAAGNPPRGCQRYEHHHEALTMRLRLLVNQHARLTRDLVRQKTRRSVLAYSLSPRFAESETYYRALSHGAVTPEELRALLETDAYSDKRASRHLVKLIDGLPNTEPPAAIVMELRHVSLQLAALEHEIDNVEALITDAIDAPPFGEVTRRWRTLPASNDVTLAALHVAARGRTTELTVDEFKASVGANPIANTSGDQKKTRMARKGYKPARYRLHMWTTLLLNPVNAPNAVYIYFHGAENRNVYAARNKLARVLWGVARDPNL